MPIYNVTIQDAVRKTLRVETVKRPTNMPEIGAVYGLCEGDLELLTASGDYDVYWVHLHAALPGFGASEGRVAALWRSTAFYSRVLPQLGAVVCSTILNPAQVGTVVGYFIESGYLGVELDVEGQQELTLLFGSEIEPVK